jgi:rare lipoprotein A
MLLTVYLCALPLCFRGQTIIGGASYYAKTFEGRKTANGELFSNYDMTCASRTLSFNTFLKVTNLKNNLTTIVRVNDRGPYAKNRLLDLTEQAARMIGCYKHGVTKIKIEILSKPHHTDSLKKLLPENKIMDGNGILASPTGYSLSIWRTRDFSHALFIANQLHDQEYIQSFYVGMKLNNKRPLYHVLITNIATHEEAERLKNFWEHKGFMRVYLAERF